MVSTKHESIVELLHKDPTLTAQMLREVLSVQVPDYRSARSEDATFRKLEPLIRQSDGVTIFEGTSGKPVFGTIGEVQLNRDPHKSYSWPFYPVAARARFRCPFFLIIVAPDANIARWAARPIDLGDGNTFRPQVIGPNNIPKIMDRSEAMQAPQLAVLSALAHGKSEVETAVSIARAAFHAIFRLPHHERLLYSDLILSALSAEAREALSMDRQITKFVSEDFQRSYDRGVSTGEAKAKAHAVLVVLKQRRLLITDKQQHRIVSCADASTLDRWLKDAVTVASVNELLTTEAKRSAKPTSAKRSNGHITKPTRKAPRRA